MISKNEAKECPSALTVCANEGWARIFSTENSTGSPCCLMYIFRMCFFKRPWKMLFGIVFYVTVSFGTGQSKAPPAKSPAPQAPTPLFSVPKVTRVDTASHPIAVRKAAAPIDSPASPPRIDSAHGGQKTVMDMQKKLNWSGVADTHRSQPPPMVTDVRRALDTNRIVGTSAPPPPQPGPHQKTPLKKSAFRSHGPGAFLDLRYGILLLSIIIIGVWLRFTLKKATQPAFVTTTRLSIMDKEVQTACRYIEKNYKNPHLSLAIVCEALVTGQAFLNALFLQELGLSVENFITHVRINRARMLLEKNTPLDAATAAGETGFENADAFSQAFIAIVGVSFEHYRDSRAQNVA